MLKRVKKKILILFLISLFSASFAFAQGPTYTLDHDRDADLSEAEGWEDYIAAPTFYLHTATENGVQLLGYLTEKIWVYYDEDKQEIFYESGFGKTIAVGSDNVLLKFFNETYDYNVYSIEYDIDTDLSEAEGWEDYISVPAFYLRGAFGGIIELVEDNVKTEKIWIYYDEQKARVFYEDSNGRTRSSSVDSFTDNINLKFEIGENLVEAPEELRLATLDNYWFCKNIDVKDWTDFTQPVSCIEETSEFLTSDNYAYLLAKLSSLTEGDEISYEITDPLGEKTEDIFFVPQDLDVWYDYRQIKIAEKNRKPGDYSVKMYINGEEVISDTFKIKEDLSHMCVEQGFYCCPSPYLTCNSKKKGICDSGVCCESEEYCKPFTQTIFSRREIPNCQEEGLNDCGKVAKLYDYNIHEKIDATTIAVIHFKSIDIDCHDKTDVAIAYYDEEAGTWIESITNVEETDAEDVYEATALIDQLGYIALVRTSECVPTLCTYGGYRTSPIGGYVNFGETITFEFCGMVTGCNAVKDGECDRNCPDGVDTDCTGIECTSDGEDCCLISYDDKCDPDCASGVDPDCCDKSKELCCPSLPEGEVRECDPNCGTSDILCSGCTPTGEDCCNSAADGTCDPDCPRTPNFVDPDCCEGSRTSDAGDCCNQVTDGTCDPDCMAGLDPDCYLEQISPVTEETVDTVDVSV